MIRIVFSHNPPLVKVLNPNMIYQLEFRIETSKDQSKLAKIIVYYPHAPVELFSTPKHDEAAEVWKAVVEQLGGLTDIDLSDKITVVPF